MPTSNTEQPDAHVPERQAERIEEQYRDVPAAQSYTHAHFAEGLEDGRERQDRFESLQLDTDTDTGRRVTNPRFPSLATPAPWSLRIKNFISQCCGLR